MAMGLVALALQRFAAGYVELFRSLPLLLLIFAFLLALPPLGLNLPIFWKLVVPIVMVNVAVLAEVFRAGIRALDRGQFEAAAAIGLTHWQSMRIVVLPQAIRMMAPALVAQLVSLLKDSTLGYVVSYPELMKQANGLTVYTHLLVQTFPIVACIYVAINLLLSQLAHWLERRSQRRPRAARPIPARADVRVDAQASHPPDGALNAPASRSARRAA
jgi:glutamate transport system permease protein